MKIKPRIDHIHITVTDLERAERYYDRLLPLLGFDLSLKEHDHVPEHEYHIVEYHDRAFSIGLVNQREAYRGEKPSRRKAGALHHLAFRADGKAEVDALYEKIRKIPQTVVVHAPRYYPEYAADYYALFFKDPEGIEYEIVSLDREKYFPEQSEVDAGEAG